MLSTFAKKIINYMIAHNRNPTVPLLLVMPNVVLKSFLEQDSRCFGKHTISSKVSFKCC